MGVAAIQLKDVSFQYTGAEDTVLEQVNLTVDYGEMVLLSGVSGEGKSTLLSIINGVIPFVNSGKLTGTVELAGQEVGGEKISSRSKIVGTVLQNADEQIVYDFANDEIAFGCENLNVPPSEIAERIQRSCELMQIEETARTRSMSGGQKQRLITASTLAMEQNIIILDEPLANLDTQGAHVLLGALKDLTRKGYAILIVEHRLDVVREYVDKVMWIEQKHVFVSTDVDRINESIKTIPPTHQGTPGQTLIEAQDISFAVNEKQIIDHLSIDVKAGERIVILGENGCGKTTLMRTLAKLNKPTGGKLSQELTKRDKADGKWFSQVGYVYQNPAYQLFMPTVLSEISYKAKSEELAKEMIKAFGLEGLEERHPQSLSEGQKRRVSIAAICAGEPKVLFLDEPTVGQDYDNLCKIVEVINRLNSEANTAVVTVTHDKRCASALADRVLLMDKGKIVREGDCHLAEDYLI